MKFSGSYLDAKVKTSKDKSGHEFYTVTFDGSATIAHASEAAEYLRSALLSEKSVVINLAAVKQVDVSFLQLLIAAGRSFAANDGSLYHDGIGAEHPFCEAAVLAGFAPSPEGVWLDFFHPLPRRRK